MDYKKVTIENVSISDAEEILEIYVPYVENTAISFEYEVPSVEEFRERIKNISCKYPYIKAVDDDGKILGYAYAGSFKGRKAYDWSVETTIYLKPDCRRGGIGRTLYTELEDRLRNMGILNANACIAVTRGFDMGKPEADEHLTNDSIYFHEKMGYKLVGTFHSSGYKFNAWYDMVWMEKMLGEHTNCQNAVKFGK